VYEGFPRWFVDPLTDHINLYGSHPDLWLLFNAPWGFPGENQLPLPHQRTYQNHHYIDFNSSTPKKVDFLQFSTCHFPEKTTCHFLPKCGMSSGSSGDTERMKESGIASHQPS
jgi:hypothetical protein